MAYTLAAFATALSVANPIVSSKVDCHGGFGCKFGKGAKFASGNIAQQLTEYIKFIDQTRIYSNGEHIACQTFSLPFGFKSHICAFLQEVDAAKGSTILRLAHFIPEFCRICGDVPFYYPEGTGGTLRFDVVSSGACPNGLC